MRLQCLGAFRLFDEAGNEIALAGRKARALIAFLALTPGWHDRETLATLLWGSRFAPQARQSLRQTLMTLRRVLTETAPGALRTNGTEIGLVAEMVTVDAIEARRALAGGDASRAAMMLTSGALLGGLDVQEPGFAEWLERERQIYADLAIEALTQLVEATLRIGDGADAVADATRLVALDPLNEGSHRLLMRAYHQIGRRVDALRQYQTCTEILRRDLDAAPSAETRALAEEIRSGAAGLGPVARPTGVAPAEPFNPSVVVLPFDNLTGEAAREYIADGLTEDVTAALAKISELFVIARHSAFTYKARQVTAPQVAAELGVRYVVEGSVQAWGERMRVTAQLIDSLTGTHIWSERYDRKLTDLFAVKDEITLNIVSSIGAKVGRGEWERLRRRETNNLDSWLLVREAFARTTAATAEDLAHAKSLLQRALDIDPGFAGAYVGLAASHRTEVVIGASRDPAHSLRLARSLLDRALAIDPQHAWAQIGAAWIHLLMRERGKELAAARRAAALAPNDVVVLSAACWIMACAGRPAEGLVHGRNALRLSPAFRPAYVQVWTARAWHLTNRLEEAEALCREALAGEPNTLWAGMAHAQLAVICAETGRRAAAREHLGKAAAVLPKLSIAYFRQSLPFQDPAPLDRWVAVWRDLGMPE